MNLVNYKGLHKRNILKTRGMVINTEKNDGNW